MIPGTRYPLALGFQEELARTSVCTSISDLALQDCSEYTGQQSLGKKRSHMSITLQDMKIVSKIRWLNIKAARGSGLNRDGRGLHHNDDDNDDNTHVHWPPQPVWICSVDNNSGNMQETKGVSFVKWTVHTGVGQNKLTFLPTNAQVKCKISRKQELVLTMGT